MDATRGSGPERARPDELGGRGAEPVPLVNSRRAAGGEAEAVFAALTELSAALEINAREGELLAQRIEALQQARSEGRSISEILHAEPPPGTLQLVSRIHARISESSGTLRRSVVNALRAEGASIPSIAQLLGVTHQRVSNLLRRRSA